MKIKILLLILCLAAISTDSPSLQASNSLSADELLPDEVKLRVYFFLDLSSWRAMSQVSKSMNTVSYDETLWKQYVFHDFICSADDTLIPSRTHTDVSSWLQFYKTTFNIQKSIRATERGNLADQSADIIISTIFTQENLKRIFGVDASHRGKRVFSVYQECQSRIGRLPDHKEKILINYYLDVEYGSKEKASYDKREVDKIKSSMLEPQARLGSFFKLALMGNRHAQGYILHEDRNFNELQRDNLIILFKVLNNFLNELQ